MPKKGKKEKKPPVDPVVERVERKKEDVKRELKMQDIMRTALARKWHQLVSSMKIPAMKEDLIARKIIFDRVMSKKQCVINEILRQKRYADDQSRLSLAAAVDITDQTIKRFGDLLEKMNLTYENERDEVLKKGAERKAEDNKMWDGEETRMGIIKWADNFNFTEKFDQMYGEGVVRHYEMENTLQADLEDTEDMYENSYSNILGQYRDEIKDYKDRTAENREKSVILKEKDDVMCEILISQDSKMLGSQKIIDDLQEKALAYEDGTAMAKIRDRYNKYKGDYYEARFQLDSDMQLDTNQFTHLVEKSNDAIWWLEGMAKKCEKIITGMNMCEGLQTPSERFSSLESMYRCTCGDNKYHNSDDIEITDNLKYLFSIMVEAEVANKALIEERRKLKEENESLRDQIKKWMKNKKLNSRR